MKIVLRWFGENDDTVTLSQIRQIPGATGVATALNLPAGEIWTMDAVNGLKEQVEASGLRFEVIESVNVHDDIKIGLPSRDKYIENYIESIKNLGKAGVKVICYNFMPIFDWTRTSLAMPLEDGSTAMAYDHRLLESLKPADLAKRIRSGNNGYSLPGWEPERLSRLQELFEAYKDVDEKRLFDNFVYFLKAIMPACEEADVKMAVHPDDPPWSLFGLPRIVSNKENIMRLLKAVDSPYNGLTLCSGSLGACRTNDIPDMARTFGSMGRIPFAHIRNIKFTGDRQFHESSHLSSDGSLDLFEIMKALHDTNFDGYIRPDHGRMIWNETARPGYGLYDRALGATYLNGLWEAIGKMKRAR